MASSSTCSSPLPAPRMRASARVLLTRLHAACPEIVLVRADNAYSGVEFDA
ncbi:hypothetical protein ACFTXB_01625 [Streptomyces sp. NPDC057074]|uniref:hypothetical protein n=1 Tax=Streptomyces sp. NPDC057074 TaxID=3346015 RepID=UPI0036389B0E